VRVECVSGNTKPAVDSQQVNRSKQGTKSSKPSGPSTLVENTRASADLFDDDADFFALSDDEESEGGVEAEGLVFSDDEDGDSPERSVSASVGTEVKGRGMRKSPRVPPHAKEKDSKEKSGSPEAKGKGEEKRKRDESGDGGKGDEEGGPKKKEKKNSTRRKK
jgi:hypothetical protein